MKRSIIMLQVMSLILMSHVQAQTTTVKYTMMNQYVNDMLYDSVSSQLLISIPSTDNIHGNSIGLVDPFGAVLSDYYFVGSEPNPIAISENQKYLYVGLDGSGKVKKFNLNTYSTVQTIDLGSDSFFGPKYANIISCKPGTDSVIAVSKTYYGVSPGYAGISVYNNGITLPDSIEDWPPIMDVVHFKNSTSLYGYDDETTGYDFSTMAVNDNGVHLLSNTSIPGSGTDFYIRDNMAYSDWGNALDLSGSAPSLAGVFNISTVWGPGNRKACIDPYLNLICFAYKGFWSDTVYIERFNATTFLKVDDIRIGIINDDVNKLVNWGDSSKYAFSTIDGNLVIINGILPAKPGPITGLTEICPGQGGLTYSILAVNGATSYTWSVPPGAIINSGQGTISVTITFGSNSGDVSVSANNYNGPGPARDLYVTLYPMPSTPFISLESPDLISSYYYGNQWYYNHVLIPGATHNTYRPTQNGEYFVIITDNNGCKSDTSNIINVTNAGTEAISGDKYFHIYPNPASDRIIIETMQAEKNGVLSICDVNGSELIKQDIRDSRTQIDIISLPGGVYYIRLSNNKTVEVGKIIKQ